jgi:NTE family protein
MKADLVLEGGGVKGIGLVGAIDRLEEDFEIARVAGTSVGSIVGSLVAAGYSAQDLVDQVFAFPFDEVKDPDPLDRVPLLGPLVSLAAERGIWNTTFVRDHLAGLLADRGIHTFADLRLPDPDSSLPPRRHYRLVVTAADVTSGELLYLPWDYRARFGLDPDEQSVADAVAASIAIPFFFEPVTLTDQRTGDEHVLVDGGLLSNFPISVFDRTDGQVPRWPTFGLKIMPRLPEGAAGLVPFAGRIPIPGVRHLEAVIATAIVGRDQTFLSRPCVKARTMQVDTAGVGVVDFDLNDDDKRHLRSQGRKAAQAFLRQWDWDAYLRECRAPPDPAAVDR